MIKMKLEQLAIFLDPNTREQTSFESLVARYATKQRVVNLLPNNGEAITQTDEFEETLVTNVLEGKSLRTIYTLILAELVGKTITKEELKKYLDRFNKVLGKIQISDEQTLAKVLSAVGAFRYECENLSLSYQGTFEIPRMVQTELPNTGVYLEIGMGPGENIIKIAQAKYLEYVIGCDISSSMVYRATKAYSTGKFFVGDAQQLPISEETIDVAIICNALDRIPTARSTIAKISKLIKPNGYLVVAQCNPFQNEYADPENGLRFVYVPKKERLESVDEAVEAAELKKVYRNDRPFEWNIMTLLYGQEKLDVNVAIGQKR